MLKFRASALDHDITDDHLFARTSRIWGLTKWFQIHDHDGNSQDMAIGFDAEGIALEIGISYIEEDDVVFHADNLTPNWQVEYNKG